MAATPEHLEAPKLLQLYFPEAHLRFVYRARGRGGRAKFRCAWNAEISESLGWSWPEAADTVVAKATRLKGSRLVMKQRQEEIGNAEADIEIDWFEKFQILSRESVERPGTLLVYVTFVANFSCRDGCANLEPLLAKTKKPGSLRLWYEAPAKAPEQTTLVSGQLGLVEVN